ncbi:MAG: Trk family potassium uptake protein [SAR202 cluster bacterium]|nr:Trk family potassium uptake protein [SAR202 cluster bacterium]
MIIVYSFVLLAIIGTILLLLPMSSNTQGWTPLRVASFTSISAITVTGLILVETSTYWTPFGQAVLFTLILLGGLGFLTGATFFLVILGQRIGLQNLLVIREGAGVRQLGGLNSWVRNVVIAALAIQAAGTAFLFLKFYVFGEIWPGVEWREALWMSAFHAVSAFNSAGFDIMPADRLGGGSLVGFFQDPIVLMIFTSLVVLGGLSYAVMHDVVRVRARWSRFRLETKMVLGATLLLVVLGTVQFVSFEYARSGTIGSMSVPEKVFNGMFHSAATRTAGFNTIDYSKAAETTVLATEVLMFIGGASTSAASGIKVTTFVVLNIAIFHTLRGRKNITLFKRVVSQTVVQRAQVVALTSIGLVGIFVYLMAAVENIPLEDLLFEAISAFSNVGVSIGVTAASNDWGRVLLMAAMFIGRFGPLTLGLWMIGPTAVERYRYVEEEVRIG